MWWISFSREFSPTHCMLFLTVYPVNFFSRCKSSSWNKFFLINDFSVWYCPFWFSQLMQHYLTHNFKIRMTLKLYFPKELIRSQSSGFTFFKSITNRLWTSCFLLNYLKVKIKQHIARYRNGWVEFCSSTALNYFYYTAHGRFSRKLKFDSESDDLGLLFHELTVRIYTKNENDPFVYISKARKQLTELETLWAVESADTHIFNKLRPIILFCKYCYL